MVLHMNYQPLSNIEIIDAILPLYTVDAAYYKLLRMRLNMIEYVDTVMTYNKKEEADCIAAREIKEDRNTVRKMRVLSEYTDQEIKVRTRYNQIRIDDTRRAINFIDLLRDKLCTHVVHSDEQKALAMEYLASTIYGAIETAMTYNQQTLHGYEIGTKVKEFVDCLPRDVVEPPSFKEVYSDFIKHYNLPIVSIDRHYLFSLVYHDTPNVLALFNDTEGNKLQCE